MPFRFNKVDSHTAHIEEEETPIDLFHTCIKTK